MQHWLHLQQVVTTEACFSSINRELKPEKRRLNEPPLYGTAPSLLERLNRRYRRLTSCPGKLLIIAAGLEFQISPHTQEWGGRASHRFIKYDFINHAQER
jgi:hypothetical protein